MLFKAEIHLIVYLKLRKDHNNENKRKFSTETSFKKLIFTETLGWNEREWRETSLYLYIKDIRILNLEKEFTVLKELK